MQNDPGHSKLRDVFHRHRGSDEIRGHPGFAGDNLQLVLAIPSADEDSGMLHCIGVLRRMRREFGGCERWLHRGA